MPPRFTIAMLLLSGLCAPALAGELKPFTASYSITWHGLSAGTSQLRLEHLADDRWSYTSQNTARGLFRLAMPAHLTSRSVFRIEGEQIIPETFTADDGGSGESRDQDIEFDWTAGRVHGVAERKQVDLPTRQGLLDTLSVQVALMHDLLEGRTPTRFVLVDKDRIKDYEYSRRGQERVRTDTGEYDTVIFSSNRPGSRNGTWFWCAPELGYLPLKVERHEGDDVQWSMRLDDVTR
jgi:Protein of unknown function (DUF3108)